MRGRKPTLNSIRPFLLVLVIKKESPNEGTETYIKYSYRQLGLIKKESPNEGTETLSPATNFPIVDEIL